MKAIKTMTNFPLPNCQKSSQNKSEGNDIEVIYKSGLLNNSLQTHNINFRLCIESRSHNDIFVSFYPPKKQEQNKRKLH